MSENYEARLKALEETSKQLTVKVEHLPTLKHIIGELRKDTDKNTAAIQGVQREVQSLSTTISRAAWTISGGVAVGTFFFGLLNVYLGIK